MKPEHIEFIESTCQSFLDFVDKEIPRKDAVVKKVALLNGLIAIFTIRMTDHISNEKNEASFPVNTLNLLHSILEDAVKINYHRAKKGECNHE